MSDINIELASTSPGLASELIETESLRNRSNYQLADNIDIIYQGSDTSTSRDYFPISYLVTYPEADLIHIYEFTIKIGRDVGIGILSAWLYDKLKDSGIREIKIGDQTVSKDETALNEVFFDLHGMSFLRLQMSYRSDWRMILVG